MSWTDALASLAVSMRELGAGADDGVLSQAIAPTRRQKTPASSRGAAPSRVAGL
jgi:hypothetical protein